MRPTRFHVPISAVAVAMAGLLFSMNGCARHPPGTYATPEEAVAAFAGVVGTGDSARSDEIFGPGSLDLFRTGDEAEDRKAAQKVKELATARLGFEEIDADTRVVLLGEQEWPFPIPLVRQEGRWRFDTAAGREELLNRRIGYYELATLSSLHAYVDAQHEYSRQGRDGNPPAFAQKVWSSEGKQDGLYWASAEGEPESPLGELLAEAAGNESDEPQPYQGYFYRILTAQGKSAPGGEKSYVDKKGLMTGGFAALAWPAKYGNSGVMTFMVSSRDIVFQKDLGPDTEKAVAAIQAFDPDPSWQPTGDRLEVVEGVDEELAGDQSDEAPAEPQS